MPELLELSGLGFEEEESVLGESPVERGPLDYALMIGAIGIGGWLVWQFMQLMQRTIGRMELPGEREERRKRFERATDLGELGIIVKCREQDRSPDRPARAQVWCLWDRKKKRVLGRHQSYERALRQERLIEMRKHGIPTRR